MQEIRGLGASVTCSRNALTPNNEVHALAEHHRYQGTDVERVGAMYVGAHVMDLLAFEPPPEGVLHIQDSCWLRGVALHESLAARQDMVRSRVPAMWGSLARLAPRFEMALFVTASVPARLKRLAQRTDADALDHLVAEDPQLFASMEAKLLDKVRAHAGEVSQLDTTASSVEDGVQLALSFITRNLRRIVEAAI